MTIDIAAFARSVAEHLPGWSVQARQPDFPWRAWLRHESGAEVVLTIERDRIRADGVYPRRGERNYAPLDPPVVRVSATRPPVATARDLTRRLLTPYLESWARAVRAAEEDAQRERADRELAAELAQIIGASVHGSRVLVTGRSAFGEITVHGLGVHVNIRWLKPETARAVLEAAAPELRLRTDS